MREEIDEVILDVLRRREAKHDDTAHAAERHRHLNREFQDFCNGELIPLLAEAMEALRARGIPAQVKVHPEIGFQKSEGVALVIATQEFHGADLLGSANRVFLLVELDDDEVSLSVHVGGNNTIVSNFPRQTLPLSGNSLADIRHLLREVVREAATVFFKV